MMPVDPFNFKELRMEMFKRWFRRPAPITPQIEVFLMSIHHPYPSKLHVTMARHILVAWEDYRQKK
jgi:hypothetical protein